MNNRTTMKDNAIPQYATFWKTHVRFLLLHSVILLKYFTQLHQIVFQTHKRLVNMMVTMVNMEQIGWLEEWVLSSDQRRICFRGQQTAKTSFQLNTDWNQFQDWKKTGFDYWKIYFFGYFIVYLITSCLFLIHFSFSFTSFSHLMHPLPQFLGHFGFDRNWGGGDFPSFRQTFPNLLYMW